MNKRNSASTWTSRHRERGRQRKNVLVQMHGEACAYCDITGPDCIFDFHHPDGDKHGAYAKFGWRMRQASEKDFRRKIIPEVMEKCIMLCANCHRIETWI